MRRHGARALRSSAAKRSGGKGTTWGGHGGGGGEVSIDRIDLEDAQFRGQVLREIKKEIGKLGPQVRADRAESASGHDTEEGTGGEHPAPDSWPEPEPLTREIPPGDPYPLGALGSVLGGAAEVIRDVIQAPDAICGQGVLGG